MAARRKITYVVGFVALCWIAIAAVGGVFIALAHRLKSTTATIIVFQVVIYSCLLGVLGSQLYKSKGARDECRSRNDGGRGWGNKDTNRAKERDEPEDTGWK